MSQKPSRLSLPQLRALLSVATHGSYSEAALETDQSQSTLSHAIAELERNLGAKLLERGRRGAKLTSLGFRVLEHARDALSSLEALEQEVALERGGLRGTVRVMALRSLATHVLPAALQQFQRLYPEVKLELIDEGREGESIEDFVRQGKADVGLLDGPIQSDLLDFPLGRDEYVLIAGAQTFLGTPGWQEIQAQPFILCDSGCTRRIRQHWEAQHVALEPAYRAREDSVILGMVAQGLGISSLPTLAIQPLPANVRVYRLPVPLERSLSLAVTRRRMTLPIVRQLVTTILDHVTLNPLETPLPLGQGVGVR